MQEQNKSFTHRLGDKLERLGERISRNGNTKLGKKVYMIGNKIEHMNVKKPR